MNIYILMGAVTKVPTRPHSLPADHLGLPRMGIFLSRPTPAVRSSRYPMTGRAVVLGIDLGEKHLIEHAPVEAVSPTTGCARTPLMVDGLLASGRKGPAPGVHPAAGAAAES